MLCKMWAKRTTCARHTPFTRYNQFIQPVVQPCWTNSRLINRFNIGGALCSTPQFGWRPLLECRAVTMPRCCCCCTCCSCVTYGSSSCCWLNAIHLCLFTVDSFHKASAFLVVVDRCISISVSCPITAVGVLFGSYFMFNIDYPSGAGATLWVSAKVCHNSAYSLNTF